jgi:hypothetical protein
MHENLQSEDLNRTMRTYERNIRKDLKHGVGV